ERVEAATVGAIRARRGGPGRVDSGCRLACRSLRRHRRAGAVVLSGGGTAVGASAVEGVPGPLVGAAVYRLESWRVHALADQCPGDRVDPHGALINFR